MVTRRFDAGSDGPNPCGGSVISLLLVGTALAVPRPVVAMGDGLVAGGPTSELSADPTVPGGWVSVLADCLEERAPGQVTVIDRTDPGDTAAIARARVSEVHRLRPRMVVVGVGARELAHPDADVDAFRRDLRLLLGQLRAEPAPRIMLVGMVPPTLAQIPEVSPGEQRQVDQRTADWNQVLADVAHAEGGVRHLDLWTEWPRDPAARSRLTVDGWRLSDQGHARVAAAVCDAIVSW